VEGGGKEGEEVGGWVCFWFCGDFVGGRGRLRGWKLGGGRGGGGNEAGNGDLRRLKVFQVGWVPPPLTFKSSSCTPSVSIIPKRNRQFFEKGFLFSVPFFFFLGNLLHMREI
jgi:hypothetical protein